MARRHCENNEEGVVVANGYAENEEDFILKGRLEAES